MDTTSLFYREIKVKENVTFDTESSTASFVSPRSMVFNRSLSVGDENTTFVTINVPFIVCTIHYIIS